MLAVQTYQVHPLVREYMLSRLSKEERTKIHLTLAGYYKERQVTTESSVKEEPGTLDAKQAEVALLRAAVFQLYHLAQAGEVTAARELAQEVRQEISVITLPPALSPNLYFGLLKTGSELDRMSDEFVKGAHYTDRLMLSDAAIGAFAKAKDQLRRARVLDKQVKILAASAQYEGALEKQKMSFRIWRRLKDIGPIVASLSNLAGLYELIGHHKHAVHFAGRAMEFVGAKLTPMEMAMLLDQQGMAFRELANFEEALSKFDRSISIKQKLNRPMSEAATWKEKGLTLHAVGRIEEAAECFNQALRVERSMDERSKIANQLRVQGLEFEVRQLYNVALSKFREAIKVALAVHSELCDQLDSDVRRVQAKIQSLESTRT